MSNRLPTLFESASSAEYHQMQPLNLSPAAQALNEYAAENFHSPLWKQEMADILAEDLTLGMDMTNPFADVATIHNVGETERVVFKETRGLKVYSVARGGYIKETQISEAYYEMVREMIGWHVTEHDDKLKANWSKSFAALLNLGKQEMTNEVYRRLHALIRATLVSGNPNWIDATGTGLTQAVLASAIDAVADAPARPGQRGSNDITVLGRRSALAPILTFTNWNGSDAAQDEVRLTGRLGTWYGASIRQLPNIVDADGVSAFPTDSIYVISKNGIDIANYGGVKVRMWDNAQVDRQHIKARREFGISLRGLAQGTVKRIQVA